MGLALDNDRELDPLCSDRFLKLKSTTDSSYGRSSARDSFRSHKSQLGLISITEDYDIVSSMHSNSKSWYSFNNNQSNHKRVNLESDES